MITDFICIYSFIQFISQGLSITTNITASMPNRNHDGRHVVFSKSATKTWAATKSEQITEQEKTNNTTSQHNRAEDKSYRTALQKMTEARAEKCKNKLSATG